MARIKGPSTNEVLRIRNKSGRFTKFKSDRDLFFYYYNTKTKKSRPIFKDKKKNAQPRRLTSRQLKFITAQRRSRFQSRTLNSTTFKINSKSYIIHQVAKHSPQIMKMLKPYQKKQKITYVYADVKVSDGSMTRSPMLAIGKTWNRDEITKGIAVDLIINQLQAANYRMSPKANDKYQGKKHTRSAVVTVAVAEFE